MSVRISTLLNRNLYDVFGEDDPARRRAAIDEIFTEDFVFNEANKNVYRGRDEIDRVIAGPEEVGDRSRIQLLEGRPGEAPVVAGTDFIVARGPDCHHLFLLRQDAPEPDSAVQ